MYENNFGAQNHCQLQIILLQTYVNICTEIKSESCGNVLENIS